MKCYVYGLHFQLPVDTATARKLDILIAHEQELKYRVAELEKREAAYLEMLTQADDMWAEMEGGYKKKIEESKATEGHLKKKVRQLIFCEQILPEGLEDRTCLNTAIFLNFCLRVSYLFFVVWLIIT